MRIDLFMGYNEILNSIMAYICKQLPVVMYRPITTDSSIVTAGVSLVCSLGCLLFNCLSN